MILRGWKPFLIRHHFTEYKKKQTKTKQQRGDLNKFLS